MLSSANFSHGMPKRLPMALSVSPLTTVYVPDAGISSVPVTGFEVTVPVVGLVNVIGLVVVASAVEGAAQGITLVEVTIRVEVIVPVVVCVWVTIDVVEVTVQVVILVAVTGLVDLVVARVVVRTGVPTATKLAASTYTSLCCKAKYGCERVHTETMLFRATASTLNSEN